MEILKQIIEIKPAFDKRDKDPTKNYGIHCVEVWMVLKGEEGAVHFGFTTGMYLPEIIDEYAKEGRLNIKEISHGYWYYMNKPIGIDVGYHSPKKMWDGQEPRPQCKYINTPCYSDGSAIRADEFLDILIRKGSDKIWELLEEEYYEIFR